MTTLVQVRRLDPHNTKVMVRMQVLNAAGEWEDEPLGPLPMSLREAGDSFETYIWAKRRLIVEEVSNSVG